MLHHASFSKTYVLPYNLNIIRNQLYYVIIAVMSSHLGMHITFKMIFPNILVRLNTFMQNNCIISFFIFTDIVSDELLYQWLYILSMLVIYKGSTEIAKKKKNECYK